jgi:hypothetical protein
MTLPTGVTRVQTLIGIAGEWNALPRIPVEACGTQPALAQVVRTYLAKHGVKQAKINITRVLQVDLDGDGTKEVLINAVSPNKYILEDRRAGDYSVVLLRKTIKGKTVTLPVKEYLFNHQESETYTLEGTFDVNGDGILEILVGWRYISGNGSVLCGVKGNKVVELLTAGGGV